MLSVPNILSIGECRHFVNVADKILADIEDDDEPLGFYKRLRHHHRELTDMIENRLKFKISGFGDCYGAKWDSVWLHPQWYFTKYDKKQHIKRHKDGVRECELRGSNNISVMTILIYLTCNFQGGETCSDNQTIYPVAGDAVLIEQDLPHWSNPVEFGTKYIVRTDLMLPV